MGGPIRRPLGRTERSHPNYVLLLRFSPLVIRYAWVAHGTATNVPKEPGQIRCSILSVAAKVVEAAPAEITEHQGTLFSSAIDRIVGIEHCTDRRHHTA